MSICSMSHLLALTLKQQEGLYQQLDVLNMNILMEEINETFKNDFKDLYTSGSVPSGNDQFCWLIKSPHAVIRGHQKTELSYHTGGAV